MSHEEVFLEERWKTDIPGGMSMEPNLQKTRLSTLNGDRDNPTIILVDGWSDDWSVDECFG